MAAFGGKRSWTDEENLRFLSLYEQMPELWHRMNVNYQERPMKIAAYKKIAACFNTNINEIRRKLHNMRCQFTTALRRLKYRASRLNVHPSEVRSDWKYFDKLSFLLVNYREFRKDDDDDMPRKIELDDATDASNHSIEFSGLEAQSDEEKNDSDLLDCTPSTSKRILHKAQEVYIPDISHKVPKKRKASFDDHRIFGEYVASELRNLSERGASKLKMKIRKAILEVTGEEFTIENTTEYLEFSDM